MQVTVSLTVLSAGVPAQLSSAQLRPGPAHPLKITPKIDAADSEAALDKTASTTEEATVEERQEV